MNGYKFDCAHPMENKKEQQNGSAPVPMDNIPAMGKDIMIGYLYDIRTA